MIFMIVSFLIHPIRFIKDWNESRKFFDRDGRPRDGSI